MKNTEKNKGGRPSQGRVHPVTVRLTAQEHQDLMAACQESGLSASDIIRNVANQIEIRGRIPAINEEALRQLAAWGNNLNQLAYAVNSGSLKGENSEQVRSALENIHAALLGVKEALK